MKPIIEVNHVWKEYQKGIDRRYKSLRDTLIGMPKKLFGAEKEKFWALEDIDFKVEAGESVGIIGRNGAGKSTLLKILSRITPPTKGEIILRGRVASLLEVGTGFHPELTGRENVFFNGSILGMKNHEIKRKFDEIVYFSGVESFIDTPLKHYSSGMQMRLAFSVAAHLDSEILLIDEVLAVGDAEFQKKCIGKMDDVSKGEGKTILFVSHNIEQIEKLCSKGILINKSLLDIGLISDITLLYINSMKNKCLKNLHENEILKVNECNILGNQTINLGNTFLMNLNCSFKQKVKNVSIAFDIRSKNGELMAHITNEDDNFYYSSSNLSDNLIVKIESFPITFTPGDYFIDLWIGTFHDATIFRVNNITSFKVIQGDFTSRKSELPKHAKLFLKTKWTDA